MKRKLIDLSNQRAQLLQSAETALAANNTADYDSAMEQVGNLNTEIGRINDLIREQDRQILTQTPSAAEARDMAEERGNILMNGGSVTFSNLEVRRAINQITVATGSIVQPTGAPGSINDPVGSMVSSILDQVYVEDMTGLGSYEVPYVITETKATSGKLSETAGTAREGTADPVFGVSQFKPYEASVTQYVDRNIARLSPVAYYAKVQSLAMKALRRKLSELIVNGDGQPSPEMFGIKTAKNKAGGTIYETLSATAVDETLLDEMYFAYGADDSVGANARLYLTKRDLKALGAIRGTNEKKKLYTITSTPGDATSGIISDGGTVIPYTIVSSLTSLSTAKQTTSPIQTMLYGDPLNYTLGLFGDYSVRVDESVKAVERMHTILGDALVGGNLTADKGFVVATLPRT